MPWQTGFMRIVVCVKHVPDADSDRRIDGGRMVRGEDDVLNELDENAVEAAVSLVEENGGEVIALTRSLNNSGLKAFDVDLMGVIKFTCIGQHIITFYIYCVFAFQSWFIVFHIRLPCFPF